MGRHACCNKENVRRGLWSPDEDIKLISHIRTYGHGCWSSVPKYAGLDRCGKSCRLRWINYLRPNLKKGSFTPQEALLIIELHQVVGNRWAQIVKHLPGRTDNEVKNFWNSSLKRKLVAHRDRHIAATNAAKNLAKSNSSVVLIPNPQMDQTVSINPHMNHPMVIAPNIQVAQYPMIVQTPQMINHPMIIPNTHMNIQMPPVSNPQPPPPEPPVVIQGFDGPIETTYDPQMMCYNPNMVPVPPSVTVPPPDFNDLPSWPPSPNNSPPIDQNQFIDQDYMYAPESPNPMLDNYYSYSSNPEMMEVPFAPFAQEQFVGSSFSPDPRFEPVHPNHINNIESLMTSFSSSTQYSNGVSTFASSTSATASTAAVPPAGLPCNGYYLGNPNVSSA